MSALSTGDFATAARSTEPAEVVLTCQAGPADNATVDFDAVEDARKRVMRTVVSGR
jgi:hypothetical protein